MGADIENITGLYLAVSASVNSVIRFLLWETGSHERVKSKYKEPLVYCADSDKGQVYSLSDSARTELEDVVTKDDINPGRDIASIAVVEPPMYRPALARLKYYLTFPCLKHKGQTAKGSSTDRFRDVAKYWWTSARHNIAYGIRNKGAIIASGFGVGRKQHIQPLRLNAVKSGFLSLEKKENLSARRYRPLVVLIHLSTESRSLPRTLLTGFIEAVLLLVLTFFFAAQWGGNLVITLIAMSLLLFFITVGRVVGFVYMHISIQTWGLHAINCDEPEQIKGSLRVLCAMKGVLVEVNGGIYFDGYRVDKSPRFRRFKEQYDKGELDFDDLPTSNVVQQAPMGYSNTYGSRYTIPRTWSGASEVISLDNIPPSNNMGAQGNKSDVEAGAAQVLPTGRPVYRSQSSHEPLLSSAGGVQSLRGTSFTKSEAEGSIGHASTSEVEMTSLNLSGPEA